MWFSFIENLLEFSCRCLNYKPVECLEPEPADPEELPGLSLPGD